MPGNKNASHFDEGKHIPWPDMVRLLADFAELGVQGVEVTGGGEPLAYPEPERFWGELARHPFATALVTNGTLLKDHAPTICASGLKWARVSIDAASPGVYSKMRHCPEHHHEKAWRAVAQLREHAPTDSEFRLGVGFVLANENIGEVREFVSRAKSSGADNVRLSVTFSSKGPAFFEDVDALRRAIDESREAEALFDSPDFRVHNLIPVRAWETEHPAQDYDRCVTQEVLCVVEGEGNVYTCCTFAGSDKGRHGNIRDHPRGFRGVWEDSADWRAKLVARRYCKVTCLYRERNLASLQLIGSCEEPEGGRWIHRGFV